MKSMLIYLEAARYKVQNALTELDGKPKQFHPLASHIHMTRDRQGLQQSVLRVPYWAKNEAMGDQNNHDSSDWMGREAGDGTSVQPDSDFGTIFILFFTSSPPLHTSRFPSQFLPLNFYTFLSPKPQTLTFVSSTPLHFILFSTQKSVNFLIINKFQTNFQASAAIKIISAACTTCL